LSAIVQAVLVPGCNFKGRPLNTTRTQERLAPMDNLITIVVLTLVGLLLVMYIELKSALRRMEDMRGDMDARIRNGLSGLDEPLKRLPNLEQRLGDVERNVAEMKLDPVQPTPPQGAALP
jgi:hypothetical protein